MKGVHGAVRAHRHGNVTIVTRSPGRASTASLAKASSRLRTPLASVLGGFADEARRGCHAVMRPKERGTCNQGFHLYTCMLVTGLWTLARYELTANVAVIAFGVVAAVFADYGEHQKSVQPHLGVEE